MYRVERAKSGRSRCQAKGSAQSAECARDDLIAKGELRVGWLNSESGTYGGWVRLGCNPNPSPSPTPNPTPTPSQVRLGCWRVPNRVWLGLPNPDTCTERAAFERALRR